MARISKNVTSYISVVDIFCGVGGLSYGLKQAGLSVSAGIDLDPMCKYPFEANCGAEFIHKDIADVTTDELVALFAGAKVRVLAGCAPCQPFSTYAQSRKTQDNRWQLLKEFLRLAISVQPEIVTMENVTRLALNNVWTEFVQGLESHGYHVSWDCVRCEELGVAQTRQRLVLIASRNPGLEIASLKKSSKRKTVRDAIGSLPEVAAGNKNATDPLHVSSSLSPINMKRIQASTAGGTWRDWERGLRAACHLKVSGETYPSVYGRMKWDEPSPTITTQFYGFGNGRFGHPDQDRAITIREAALLQSFPKGYKFVRRSEGVSFRRLGILIGNAVPPRLGKAVGEIIRDHALAAF